MIYGTKKLAQADVGKWEFRRRFMWIPTETLDGRKIWLEYAVQYREVKVRYAGPLPHPIPIYYWTRWRTLSRSDTKKLCADGHMKTLVGQDGTPTYRIMQPMYDRLPEARGWLLSE